VASDLRLKAGLIGHSADIAASASLAKQTLGNWIKLHRAGTLKGSGSKQQVSAERIELGRLRAELARVSVDPQRLVPDDADHLFQ
jgi:transposase-like protein